MTSRTTAFIAIVVAACVSSPVRSRAADDTPATTTLDTVTVQATIGAIDRDEGTVTVVGPDGAALVLVLRDLAKLDVINVGDPVVAQYYEAIAVETLRPGVFVAGMSREDSTVSSQPGEPPAATIRTKMTLTTTVIAVDATSGTVTIRGPRGAFEPVKVNDPANLDNINVGDLVQITYVRAFAVSLDKR